MYINANKLYLHTITIHMQLFRFSTILILLLLTDTNSFAFKSNLSVFCFCTYIRNRLLSLQGLMILCKDVFIPHRSENEHSAVAVLTGKVIVYLTKHALINV